MYSTRRLPIFSLEPVLLLKVRIRLLLATMVTFVTTTVIFGTDDVAKIIDCSRDRFKPTISVRTLKLTLLRT